MVFDVAMVWNAGSLGPFCSCTFALQANKKQVTSMTRRILVICMTFNILVVDSIRAGGVSAVFMLSFSIRGTKSGKGFSMAQIFIFFSAGYFSGGASQL